MFKGHFTKDHSLPSLSLTNPQKCHRIDQNNPESTWRCLVGITTNPEFKIRPSLTTSKEGLKNLTYITGQGGFNSELRSPIVMDIYDQNDGLQHPLSLKPFPYSLMLCLIF
jgi:hypothetical protein